MGEILSEIIMFISLVHDITPHEGLLLHWESSRGKQSLPSLRHKNHLGVGKGNGWIILSLKGVLKIKDS